MLNWDNKIHNELRVGEIIGLLEDIENPTFRDIEVIGLYWFLFNGHEFCKTRKSLQDLVLNTKHPFCSGHNILTTYKGLINENSKLDEEHFNNQLKEMLIENRIEFLIDTTFKSYYLIKTFNLKN